MSVDEKELKELQHWLAGYCGVNPEKPPKRLPGPIAALIAIPLMIGIPLAGLYLLVQFVKVAWLH